MNVILNFLPVAEGGGIQNVLSFLDQLSKDNLNNMHVKAVVRGGSKVHLKCLELGMDIIAVKNNLLGRFLFEIRCRKLLPRGKVCFTFFGPPMLVSQNYLVNIVGCAYSNLFYPEIDFWGYKSRYEQFKMALMDLYRKRITARADFWIFETPVLAKRAVEVRGFCAERVGVVRMAPSNLVSPDNIKPQLSKELEQKLPKGFKFLCLSGASPHKRHHLLAAIASSMRKSGYRNFCFITTMDMNSAYAQKVFAQFDSMNLKEHIFNIGPVFSDEVATLIDRCDAMCCFSLLESFSNNFVETWRMERPLIVTDSDWARDACGEGAIYVNPQDSVASAETMIQLMKDSAIIDKLVAAGHKQLATYPSAAEKNRCYYEYLEKARKLGFCPASLRKQITWSRGN